MSPFPYVRFHIFLISVFYLTSVIQASPTRTIPVHNSPPLYRRLEATPTASVEVSAAKSLGEQLKNPAEVLAVLLILGGDIIQKAIAQNVGRRFVPVAFSFGWVAYALTATMSIFGDQFLIPEPDNTVYVINPRSGNVKRNESWLLGRLVRDLEFLVDDKLKDKKKKKGILITRWTAGNTYETIEKRSQKKQQVQQETQFEGTHRDLIWWSYFLVLITQLGVATFPPMFVHHHRNWRILYITGAGNILSVATASLRVWRDEKFRCRPTKKPITFVLTRGNGHRHAFVIEVNAGISSHNLEDLAIRRPCEIDRLTKVSFIFSTGFWVFLLISIGGLEEDTWYLLIVGIVGTIHSLVVAGSRRTAKAHGVPLEAADPLVVEDPRDPEKYDQGQMAALKSAEEAKPGIGLALLRIFFPGDLGDDQAYWDRVRGPTA